MNIPDRSSESLETVFWVKNMVRKLFDADPDPVSGTFDLRSGSRDGKNSDPQFLKIIRIEVLKIKNVACKIFVKSFVIFV
jgi:hypothetical protein